MHVKSLPVILKRLGNNLHERPAPRRREVQSSTYSTAASFAKRRLPPGGRKGVRGSCITLYPRYFRSSGPPKPQKIGAAFASVCMVPRHILNARYNMHFLRRWQGRYRRISSSTSHYPDPIQALTLPSRLRTVSNFSSDHKIDSLFKMNYSIYLRGLRRLLLKPW